MSAGIYKIALVSINRNKYSETFIHNHVRRLPAEVHFLTGDYLPYEVSIGWEGPVTDMRQAPGTKWYQKSLPPTELSQTLANYLKSNQIQAVLAEYGPSGVEMMDICEAVGIPLIVHFHGYDAYRQDMLAAFGARYPILFQKAAALIAVSAHMHTQLIQLGAPPEKVHLNPCGPDETQFTYQDAGANPPVLLAVGRFAETKSPHLTLLAFARALKQVPAAKLIFCGGGHLELACKLMVQALQLTDRVEFRGAVAHATVAKLMSQARAFVQHSIITPEHDLEGTPVSIQEASLAGLPVVSTLHGGIPEVILNGKTGFLVAEGDLQAMADHMVTLLTTPTLATQMGQAGHQHIRSKFTLSHHLEQLWEVIKTTI